MIRAKRLTTALGLKYWTESEQFPKLKSTSPPRLRHNWCTAVPVAPSGDQHANLRDQHDMVEIIFAGPEGRSNAHSRLRVATCWGIPSSSSEPPNIETTDPTRRLVPIIPPSLLVLTSPVLQQSVHPTELFTQVLAENSQLLASVTITNSVAREPSESWFPAKLFDEYDRNGLKHLKP